MQVTVVDTGGAVIKDVVFPEVDTLKGSKWEKNRDSIRLTSGAVKEFSIEGKKVFKLTLCSTGLYLAQRIIFQQDKLHKK